jgi:hypothetical protein
MAEPEERIKLGTFMLNFGEPTGMTDEEFELFNKAIERTDMTRVIDFTTGDGGPPD